MTATYLFDSPPEGIAERLNSSPLISANADVDETGRFDERWFILTHDIVYICSSDNILRELSMHHIIDMKTELAVGGGSLVADTTDGPVVLVRYTAALAKKFGLVSIAVSALVKGESLPPVSERELPRLCPSCGRPLQDGTSVCPVCVDKGKVVARLLNYASSYRKPMVLAAASLLVVTVLQLIPPYLTKVIVDDVIQPKEVGHALLWLVATLFGVNFLNMVLQGVRGYVGVWFGSRIMGDIRRDVFNSLMRQSLNFFDKRQTSQFIGRVNSDAQMMLQFMTDGIIFLASQLLMLVSIVVMMLRLNWFLAVLSFLTTPLILFASLVIWPYIRHRMYRQWRAMNLLNTLVGDTLQGIRVVKAFGQEPEEINRYKQANSDLISQTTRTEGMWQGLFPLFSFLTGIGILLVWYFGGWQVIHGSLSLGTLMAFISYLGMFFGPLQWFSQMINWASSALTAADRVFEIIDTKSNVQEAGDAVDLHPILGRVNFNEVTFGYEKHIPILKKLNLKVEPGEMIGLVGHSGAGKSTFINLLSRFYDPDQGEILIDGIDLRKIRQEDIHRQIGVVLQETFLFDGTVSENIAYSKPDATPAEIIKAAKIANAHQFILKMPDGYDTRVGERGQRLSGGEKQRIAIARAVLHDPRILILDEATASLDTETERQIQEALSRLVQGRTTFAIAHRLSTLRNANRLVVIDHGKITEVGSHEELMKKKGTYFQLVEAQREMSQMKEVSG